MADDETTETKEPAPAEEQKPVDQGDGASNEPREDGDTDENG